MGIQLTHAHTLTLIQTLLLNLLSLLLSFPHTTTAACDYGTFQYPREANVPISKFSYDAQTGPLNWVALNTTANVLCDEGTSQSPITLSSAANATKNDGTVVLNIPSYPNGALFENLGTNVEVVVNGTLSDGGKVSQLMQFHFHTPSEHRIDDEYFPMEAHFVFQAADNTLTVVAFLIDLSNQTTPLLTSIFNKIPQISQPGNTTTTSALNFTSLQNHIASNTVYRYTGSLTTPPCSENVTWIISSKALEVGESDFKSVKGVIRFNSRFTQDVLGGVNLLEEVAEELKGQGQSQSQGLGMGRPVADEVPMGALDDVDEWVDVDEFLGSEGGLERFMNRFDVCGVEALR